MLQTIRNFSPTEKMIAWREAANLFLMLAAQIGILLALGQPCIRFGTIALALGMIGGYIKNQVDSGSLAKTADAIKRLLSHQKRRSEPQSNSCDVLVPVVLLISEHQLARMDVSLRTKDMRTKDIFARRRRWIMAAIKEKLDREHTPDLPAAA